jgi:hypothetical protein
MRSSTLGLHIKIPEGQTSIRVKNPFFMEIYCRRTFLLPGSGAITGDDVQLPYATAWLDGERSSATLNATATPTQIVGSEIVDVLAAIEIAIVIAKRK